MGVATEEDGLSAAVISGRYRDVLINQGGRLTARTPWRCNTIVDAAWPLVAGLLRSEAGLHGILYCAVGAGDPAWDVHPATAGPGTTRLARELTRVPVAPGDLTYVDGQGRAATGPTSRLEAVITLPGPASEVTLREFGLFGGDATAAANSGYLINYVIHAALALRPGNKLVRRVRLSFRPATPGTGGDTLGVPRHAIGTLPATALDGVGPQIGAALERAGAPTVRAVAQLAAGATAGDLSTTRIVELRAKARLAVRTGAALPAITSLDGYEAHALLAAAPASLSAETGVPLDTVDGLQDLLARLQLALDARTLRRMTLKQLREGP